MNFRTLLVLIVMLIMIPVTSFADDDFFDEEDDFGTDEKAKQDTDDFSSDDSLNDLGSEKEDNTFEEKKDSSADALGDLLGEEKKPEAPIEEKKPEVGMGDIIVPPANKVTGPLPVRNLSLKPVLMVKGAMYANASYKIYDGSKKLTQGLIFGGVDDSLLGLNYDGKAVIANATVYYRSENKLLTAANYNPRAVNNYGAGLNVGEVYAGVKLLDEMISLKAGYMAPAYGVSDYYTTFIMMGTPFGTRSLVMTEGYVPEALGAASAAFNYKVGPGAIDVNLMLGSYSDGSYSDSDKTYAFYAKAGYVSDIFTGYVNLQYRNDYDAIAKKDLLMSTYGIAAKVDYAGFKTLFTFDYNSFQLLKQSGTKYLAKSTTGMLLSVTPAYDIKIGYKMLDALQLAVRFDYIQGLYKVGATDYLKFDTYSDDTTVMRLGVAANLFVAELSGVKSSFGITFLTQTKADFSLKTDKDNEGFSAFLITGSAEF